MEKEKTPSSQPGVNEGREGSLTTEQHELENMETQDGKGTSMRVLTVGPPSLEVMDLVVPLDLPPRIVSSTGSDVQVEKQEVASTSKGISRVEKIPPGTASSSTLSASQRAMKAACTKQLPVSVISVVKQLINNRLPDLMLGLDAGRDVPAAQTCSTSPTTRQLAQEMLTKVSAMLQADADSQVSRRSGTSSPTLQVSEDKAKADLGSAAAEVIVAVIVNVLAARAAALQEEAGGLGTFSSVSYFLSAVCADVQTLPLLRRSGSSSSRSLVDLLSTLPRTNMVQAVEQKLEEHFGPCEKECSATTPSSPSPTEDTSMIPYLRRGHSGRSLACDLVDEIVDSAKSAVGHSQHSLASDLVEEIIDSIKSAVEVMESPFTSSRAGICSSLTRFESMDVSSVAQKMVCKAADKLTPLVSSSRMVDVSADESSSLLSESSLESLPMSLVRLLLIRSVDTVSTACRAISSEFCYRESVMNEGLDKLRQLANEQMLACINKGVQEVEVDEIIQGISAILDHSLILRRPEMSFSHIYRSLFVDCPLPQSGNGTGEVLETVIFVRPQSPPTAEQSVAHDMRVGTIIKEYVTKGKDLLQQALRRATLKFSCQPSTPHGSPHAANPESSERPSLLVSSENCENLYGAILDDLHKVVEQHKASAKARSGGRNFWEHVHSSSQKLYDSTLKYLQKVVVSDQQSAREDPELEIIPPKASFSWTKRTLGVILCAMRAEVAASESSAAELKSSEESLVTCALLDSILESLNQLCKDEEGTTACDAAVALGSTCFDPLQIKSASESLLTNVHQLLRQTGTSSPHLQGTMGTPESVPMLPGSTAITSRQKVIHSFAESSVKSQLQKCLELNVPPTSRLVYQETLDRTVSILTERVMDVLCESTAAAPRPGEGLCELSPAAVIDEAGTASTSAGEVTKLKGSKWWRLPKKVKIFKNKFLKRKMEPKKPISQEELPTSSHNTSGAECGPSANLDHESKQEPCQRPLHVRMFRALRKTMVKTFKMSGSQ